MENTELKQIKATIDLMSGTIGTLVRVVERITRSPVDTELATRLKETDKAKSEALGALEFLDSTGRL
jgi:hypothetical protein